MRALCLQTNHIILTPFIEKDYSWDISLTPLGYATVELHSTGKSHS